MKYNRMGGNRFNGFSLKPEMAKLVNFNTLEVYALRYDQAKVIHRQKWHKSKHSKRLMK